MTLRQAGVVGACVAGIVGLLSLHLAVGPVLLLALPLVLLADGLRPRLHRLPWTALLAVALVCEMR